MNIVLARIKRLRVNPYRKLFSDQTLFEVDLKEPDECVEYDPNTLLDDDDWYKISDFSLKEYCPDILKAEFNSVDYANMELNQFGSITHLIAKQHDDFFFQRIRASSFVSKKIIVFGEAAKLEKNQNRLVLNPLPDAIYRPSSDMLIFRDLPAIAPIFHGVDELFREATEGQVEEFLLSDFISSSIPAPNVSKPNRKRIALALESLKNMSPEQQHGIVGYIANYLDGKIEFDESTKKFKISTDDDLKHLIFGIEQRYYTTQIGDEKRLANSIVTLK